MAEIIACSACGKKLQVPESFLGQTVQCPQCAHQFLADVHAQNVQSSAPAAPPAERAPARIDDDDDFPRRRRRSYEDDVDDDDDDYDFRRPLRRSGIPHRGGLILALGLIALVGGISFYLPFALGPVAWIMGNSDLNEIREGRMDPSGEGLAQAGRVLGIISTVFFALGLAGVCLIVMLIAMAGR